MTVIFNIFTQFPIDLLTQQQQRQQQQSHIPPAPSPMLPQLQPLQISPIQTTNQTQLTVIQRHHHQHHQQQSQQHHSPPALQFRHSPTLSVAANYTTGIVSAPQTHLLAPLALEPSTTSPINEKVVTQRLMKTAATAANTVLHNQYVELFIV